MGHVGDTEGSLAVAGSHRHLCPWLQEDGTGAPWVPQEPAQVGGLLAQQKSQAQCVTRHLQLGVQAEGPGDRWQQLAVPGFRMAEDKAATRLVVLGALTRRVMEADAGVPLVAREASTIEIPLVVDITLCCESEASEKRPWGRGS